jgi:hypothetical protein
VDAGIRVQRHNQHVTERARLFEKLDVARVQEVITAIGEDNGLAVPAPVFAKKEQFVPRANSSHQPEVPLQCNAAVGVFSTAKKI